MEPQIESISKLLVAAREDLLDIRQRCRDEQVVGGTFDRILELFDRLKEPPGKGLAFALLEVAEGRAPTCTPQEVAGLLLAASRRIESDSGEILRLRTDLLAAERLAFGREP